MPGCWGGALWSGIIMLVCDFSLCLMLLTYVVACAVLLVCPYFTLFDVLHACVAYSVCECDCVHDAFVVV